MIRAHCWLQIIVLVIAANTVELLIENQTNHDVKNSLNGIKTRRHASQKGSLSTSSDSADHKSTDGSETSLGISSESSSTSEERDGIKPKSTEERRGWRKWHRKCTPCPDDMIKKWRDRSISWICGGYQRARRSFKSDCMMHYRNCQDGTMFVKIHDMRCQNDSGTDLRHGLHFFYEYGGDSQDSRAGSLSDSSPLYVSSDLSA